VVLGTPRAASRALLLDVDGTLVDTAYLHTLAWQRAAARRGHLVEARRIHRLVGMGGDKLVPALLGEEVEEREGDALREAWSEEFEALRPEVRALPGAHELLEAADRGGWNVVFASSAPADHLDQYLRLIGGEGRRDDATVSDDVDETKPEPDIVGVALERAGTHAAVLVGDATHDVEAARRAGIPCACVLTGGYGEAELLDAGAAFVCEDAAAMAERLAELESLAAGAASDAA
jgi:HAD superfamily hydrolase (TIGR01549 family)